MYHSSQMQQSQWESYRAISNLVGGSEQLCLEPEVCLNSQRNEHRYDIPVLCFEFPKNFDSLCQSSGDNSNDTTEQDGSTTQFRNSLRSVDESFMSSSEKYSTLDGHFTQEHNKSMGGDATPVEIKSLPISSQRNQPEKKSSRPCGVACVTSSNSVSRTVPTGKKRIRWTKDLHEQFVMVVNCLGGPQNAKPKAILQMMNTDALTILQVKSHLQKYRTSMHVQKAFQERSERHEADGVTELQLQIHMQIEESRQLQLEVQRSLQEQLETQRNLLLLIDQQRKQLPTIFEDASLSKAGACSIVSLRRIHKS